MRGLDQLFDQFLRERTYIYNVTAKTRDWYQSAWHAFKQSQTLTPTEITKADLLAFVVHLRERGVKPVSCNTWLRAMNAFCRWLHEQGEASTLVKLRPQGLEKRIIRTHDEAALRVVLAYRPKTFDHWRIHAPILVILDTGCRITELLTAAIKDFDFDNLLLTVYGKGRKERRVPMSIDLRKILFRWGQVKERAEVRSPLMFPTRDGGRWHQRNALRSYYCLTKRLWAAAQWLSSTAPHVRHPIPPQRRGSRAAVDHPRA
jgi:integrase/recombinase XerD